MNKTKQRILDTALTLFNELGLAEVSLRTIAEKTGISVGNLTYHFKKREDIVEDLYYEFVASVDERFKKVDTSHVNLVLIFEMINVLTVTRLKYRFLMRDFISLVAENPRIKKHYASVIKTRREQSMALFTILVENKIIRPAELDLEYELLYDRIQILGNFWITSAIMQGERLNKTTVERYHDMVVQVIYPYLTSKGLKEWENIRANS